MELRETPFVAGECRWLAALRALRFGWPASRSCEAAKGAVCWRTDELTVQAMRDKGLDPENRKKVGHGRGVRWTLLDNITSDSQDGWKPKELPLGK